MNDNKKTKVLKCISCGKTLKDTDDVFVVTTISTNLVKYHSPTCSEKCANDAKKRNIAEFQQIIDEIKDSNVYDTNVNMYPQSIEKV